MSDYTHHYKKWHSTHDAHIKSMQAFYLRALKKYWPSDKKSKVLDVGCGMGFLLMAMKNEGYSDLEGFDIDRQQIASAKTFGLQVAHAENSIEFLNQRKNQYDFLTAIDVIEHVEPHQQIEFVKAMFGALKNGGSLVCTVPNANSTLAGRWRYIDWTHKTSFTEHSLDFLLHAAGFQNVKIREVELYKKYDRTPSLLKLAIEHLLQKLMRGWRRLEMISELGCDEAAKIPLSVNLLACAEKN